MQWGTCFLSFQTFCWGQQDKEKGFSFHMIFWLQEAALALSHLGFRLPGYLILKLVIHASCRPDVSSFFHLQVGQQAGDHWLRSGPGCWIKQFHVWSSAWHVLLATACASSAGTLKECLNRRAQVSKAHFQNCKWPLMTSVLINCGIPGVLGGDTLRPSFPCVIIAPLSQKGHWLPSWGSGRTCNWSAWL